MQDIFLYALVCISVGVSTLILMQQSDAGMGSLFGDNEDASISRTRRGLDKTIFNATIIFTSLFALISLTHFLLL
jgi:preprotein translocase subunit SecG